MTEPTLSACYWCGEPAASVESVGQDRIRIAACGRHEITRAAVFVGKLEKTPAQPGDSRAA